MADTYYWTNQGDTWDQIALEYLGSEYYMDQLMQANPKLLDIIVFPAGVELVIPDLSDLEEDYDEDDDLTNLPEWRSSDDEDASDEDADFEDDPDMMDDTDDTDEAEPDEDDDTDYYQTEEDPV